MDDHEPPLDSSAFDQFGSRTRAPLLQIGHKLLASGGQKGPGKPAVRAETARSPIPDASHQPVYQDVEGLYMYLVQPNGIKYEATDLLGVGIYLESRQERHLGRHLTEH